MEHKDIRWIQRLNNFLKALSQLENAVNLAYQRDLSELEKQGLIQAFEFTFELAWKVMKDYFYFQGNNSIHGSRDAIKEAFNNDLIKNGHLWMDMIVSRNKTSHTYDENTTSEIVDNIINKYYSAFVDFKNKMLELKDKNI